MSEGPSSPKRLRLDYDDIGNLNREELIEKLRELDDYVAYIQAKQRGSLDKDDGDDKEGDDKLKQQSQDSSRRENTLVLRLTNKEQELQDCMNQIAEMKASQTQNSAQLRSLLLDPAVNLVFQRMAKEMDDCKEKLKQTQNELSAWKFTADSQMGKRLMAKCRMLLQENEELGKMISSGRTSKLEAEIALQKTMVTEMKTNQDEMNEFVNELEEDVEGMQSMIYVLQQQLKETKEHLTTIEAENARLRTLQSASLVVKQEHAGSSNSLTGADGSGGGGGSCGGDSCAADATHTNSGEMCRVIESGSGPKNQSALSSESNRARTTDSQNPQNSSSKAETAQQPHCQGLSKRTSGRGDDVDGAQQHPTNGRTTDVMQNSGHSCSHAPVETVDLRADQAYKGPVTKIQLDGPTTESSVKADKDGKSDNPEMKVLTNDVKPIHNGGLEGVPPPGGECEK